MDFGNYSLTQDEIKETITIHVVVYSWCMRDMESISDKDRNVWEDAYQLIKKGGIYQEMYKFSLESARKNNGQKGVCLERLEKNLTLLKKGFLDS